MLSHQYVGTILEIQGNCLKGRQAQAASAELNCNCGGKLFFKPSLAAELNCNCGGKFFFKPSLRDFKLVIIMVDTSPPVVGFSPDPGKASSMPSGGGAGAAPTDMLSTMFAIKPSRAIEKFRQGKVEIALRNGGSVSYILVLLYYF